MQLGVTCYLVLAPSIQQVQHVLYLLLHDAFQVRESPPKSKFSYIS